MSWSAPKDEANSTTWAASASPLEMAVDGVSSVIPPGATSAEVVKAVQLEGKPAADVKRLKAASGAPVNSQGDTSVQQGRVP